MRPDLRNRIARLADDRESGASEILQEVLSILRAAREHEGELAEVASAVCLAQPSMGSIWNAAQAAVAGDEPLARFAQRVARAPAAITRFAVDLFAAPDPHDAIRVVTISYSRTVLEVLASLAREHALEVACPEGRPALEGRTLAGRLAARGVVVTVFSDAAIGHAISTAGAVVVGADAVGPEFFLNKSGTRLLAAAAMLQGVPCYVLAGRDKFVSREIASRLSLREGKPTEIWSDPPPRVSVRNPYFEAIPLDLVAGLISDAGILSPTDAAELCR
jgi:translation initiation factor 2B subunit (eIF-2B alpha/beta/delta family)